MIKKHFNILAFHKQKQKIKNHKWRTIRQFKSYLFDKNKIRKTIRFTQTEWEQIEQKINEHNLTFAEFARGAILNTKVKTKLTLDYIFQLQKIEKEISRMGNNLNQIAKNLNSKKDIPNSEVIEKIIKLNKKINEIKDDIKISAK